MPDLVTRTTLITSKQRKFGFRSGILLVLLHIASHSHSANERSVTAADRVRVATFNVSMHSDTADGLFNVLQRGTLIDNPDRRIANVASIIRRIKPDIILLNEFDYREDAESIRLFKRNYLEIETESSNPQLHEPINYPHYFTAPSNTGIPSGVDFNNDSISDGNEDVYGYGAFPGQYGMVVLSRFPVVTDQVRTFQNFLWRDMPEARLPTTSIVKAKPKSYYSKDALSVFRLSSKSHWDIPVTVNGKVIHLLASHPTPPVFDGPEDKNGLRNHDEIRFWADYISLSEGQYIYDDNGLTGPLPANRRFVILGDLNASPVEGESTDNPMQLLLNNDVVNGEFVPTSRGAMEKSAGNSYAPGHTTTWSLRVDYVLPSRYGLRIADGAVFWPASSEPGHRLINEKLSGSDHRLVWLDLEFVENVQPK